jgi:ribosomal protein S18 acetylase RimI-like enzyme
VDVQPLALEHIPSCEAIIRSLPYHFVIDEESDASSASAPTSVQGLVATQDGAVVGFLTIRSQSDDATEISSMAVRSDLRGRGIGTYLIEHLARDHRAAGKRLIVVLTISAAHDEPGISDGYELTRAFYRSVGFIPAMELPDLWPDHPALLLMKIL